MKKNLKTVSVAIPKNQFMQIVDYMEKCNQNGKPDLTVASFLREAISDFLIREGYDEIKATFAPRQGRPSRRR